MKITLAILMASLAALPLPGVTAHPGMENTLKEVEAIARRQDTSFSANMLLGDLRTLEDSELSQSGKAIKDILQGKGNPQSSERYVAVPKRDSKRCRKDTCCVWKYIADDMADNLFRGRSGRCTKWARFAIRMGFHDAGTWSLAVEKPGGGGGADGSIVLGGELEWLENAGLRDMGAKYKEVYDKYRNTLGFSNVGMADLIQMGANVATVVCPLGPRTRSWVGRKDSNVPNTRGLLPSVFGEAEPLIRLFQDKTISPRGLIALLGAHTTSQQTRINVTRAGDPQDSTPGVWDTLYYRETLGTVKAPERVFMFPSDVNLARYAGTKGDFEDFAGRGGQAKWNEVCLMLGYLMMMLIMCVYRTMLANTSG